MHPLSRNRCVPGFMGGSPVKISLSLKSVVVYLCFCQNQRRLRFTTTVSTEMLSFGLNTGISELPTSTSSTKFLVAAANMAWLEAARFAKTRSVWLMTVYFNLTLSTCKQRNKIWNNSYMLIANINLEAQHENHRFKKVKLVDILRSSAYPFVPWNFRQKRFFVGYFADFLNILCSHWHSFNSGHETAKDTEATPTTGSLRRSKTQ